MTSLWKKHQNVVAVNTVVVDQSIYARNAMLLYPLIVSRTIIHVTQLLVLFPDKSANNVNAASILEKI